MSDVKSDRVLMQRMQRGGVIYHFYRDSVDWEPQMPPNCPVIDLDVKEDDHGHDDV